jgi:hypothetical protein
VLTGAAAACRPLLLLGVPCVHAHHMGVQERTWLGAVIPVSSCCLLADWLTAGLLAG